MHTYSFMGILAILTLIIVLHYQILSDKRWVSWDITKVAWRVNKGTLVWLLVLSLWLLM
jgi:hypothetical protein